MPQQDPLGEAMDRDLDPSDATRQGISGAILAVFGVLIIIFQAIGEGFENILGRISDLGDLISAFFTNPIIILEGTARETVAVLTGSGEWAFFGPATFAVGVFSVVLAYYVWDTFRPSIPFFGAFFDRFDRR